MSSMPIGLNLVLRVAGQFSLGHAAFIAVGAYSGAIFATRHVDLGGLWTGMLVGAVVAAGCLSQDSNALTRGLLGHCDAGCF